METVKVVIKLDDWFADRLTQLRCSADARAYVVGVLMKYRSADEDLSRRSIVLAYCDARETGRFENFQRVGDWALWVSALQPNESDREIVESLGRMSYYTCHRLMRRSWPVYEELADELPVIASGVRCNLLP